MILFVLQVYHFALHEREMTCIQHLLSVSKDDIEIVFIAGFKNAHLVPEVGCPRIFLDEGEIRFEFVKFITELSELLLEHPPGRRVFIVPFTELMPFTGGAECCG